MTPLSDAKIIDSWLKNTAPWTEAVRSGAIASRTLATNQAIVDAVRSRSPRSGVDIGCGEGWLVRALDSVAMVGVDVVPGLIDEARRASPEGGDFRVMSYEDLAAGKLNATFDVAVCNFSLLGKESVEALFQSTGAFLRPGGSMIVQTIHPLAACDEGEYRDGWREGSWAGFSTAFSDPAPWYFRTLGGWLSLFSLNGMRLVEVREPLHPETGKPLSLIMIGETAVN